MVENNFKSILMKPIPMGALVLRLWIGFAMISHSVGMLFNVQAMQNFAGYVAMLGFPLPVVFAYLAKGSEFFGGILIFMGLLTRPAALLVISTMSVATFLASEGQVLGKGELPFCYLIMTIVLFLKGPGPFSLDAKVWKSRSRHYS